MPDTVPKPDFEQFLHVLQRDEPPTHLPFYEHIASPGFIAERTGVDISALDWNTAEAWQVYVDFWINQIIIKIFYLNCIFFDHNHLFRIKKDHFSCVLKNCRDI